MSYEGSPTSWVSNRNYSRYYYGNRENPYYGFDQTNYERYEDYKRQFGHFPDLYQFPTFNQYATDTLSKRPEQKQNEVILKSNKKLLLLK